MIFKRKMEELQAFLNQLLETASISPVTKTNFQNYVNTWEKETTEALGLPQFDGQEISTSLDDHIVISRIPEFGSIALGFYRLRNDHSHCVEVVGQSPVHGTVFFTPCGDSEALRYEWMSYHSFVDMFLQQV